MAQPVVHVKGLAELNRAFKHVDRDVRVGFRGLLLAVAEPVRRRAEMLAVQNITNVGDGDKWSKMRTGVTVHSVYVAPQPRSRKGIGPQKRPAFGPMLLHEAMEPALLESAPEIAIAMEKALDHLLAKDF